MTALELRVYKNSSWMGWIEGQEYDGTSWDTATFGVITTGWVGGLNPTTDFENSSWQSCELWSKLNVYTTGSYIIGPTAIWPGAVDADFAVELSAPTIGSTVGNSGAAQVDPHPDYNQCLVQPRFRRIYEVA
jgi:hypothetical protein